MKLSDLRRQARKGALAKPPNLVTPKKFEVRTQSAPPTLQVHVALYDSAGKEVAYSGYRRMRVTLRDASDGRGLYDNTERVTFPASAGPGTVVKSVVIISVEEDIPLELDRSFSVSPGDSPFFEPGVLRVVLAPTSDDVDPPELENPFRTKTARIDWKDMTHSGLTFDRPLISRSDGVTFRDCHFMHSLRIRGERIRFIDCTFDGPVLIASKASHFQGCTLRDSLIYDGGPTLTDCLMKERAKPAVPGDMEW